MLKTEDGLKPISEIKVGDKVQAVSDEDVYTDSELKEVTNVLISTTDILVKVTVDGEEIKTTETHPWYVEGKGFIYADYIEVGDKVRTDSGEVTIVEKVEEEKLPIKIVVINLTVKDNRTYFVDENEILVHNTCMETELPKRGSKADKPVYKYWNNSVEFKGNKVYQRNDLFDSNTISSRKVNGKKL